MPWPRTAGVCLTLLVMTAILWPIDVRAGNGTCLQTQTDTCIDGPATRTVNGLDVTRDCWRYQAAFTCQASTLVDDCQALRDQGCSQVGSNCVDTNASGICTLFEQTYQCRAASGPATTLTNCGTQQFCLDSSCFAAGSAPDADFAKVVAGLEIQREAGQYLDPNSLQVFQGYDNRCHKSLFGLVNCCQGAGSSGSLFTDMNLILGAGGQVVDAVGSRYTYDALYAADAPTAVMQGFEALFGAGGGSSALADLIAGNVSVESFVDSLVPGPWTVAMLAIQLSGLLSCDQAEQVLAMKRDHRLCHGTGSYCSQKVPVLGTCIETTQSYCCFNSSLARIVNEQGRAQLGRDWGSAQSPDCSGFTLTQLQSLDFSRMDLSEFYAEIAPTLPDVGAIGARAQQKIQMSLPP